MTDTRSKPWRDPSLPDGDCIHATDAQRQALVEAEFGAYPTASFNDVPLARNVSRVSAQSGTQHVLPSGVEGYDEKGRGGAGGQTLEYHAEKGETEAQREHDENQVLEEASRMEYVEPGWKGWLNCAGSFLVNMLCCKSSHLWGCGDPLTSRWNDTVMGCLPARVCPRQAEQHVGYGCILDRFYPVRPLSDAWMRFRTSSRLWLS